ncbi:MAG: nucleoside-diphosphate kinase [Chromatiales bacterium]
MAIERTFSIIKPDAVAKKKIGEILARFERNGLRLLACKMLRLTWEQAEAVYGIHRGKSFYNDLIAFMTSGPVVVSVLEGDDAVQKHRDMMGMTDPRLAEAGTIRADFAESISRNAVHGSDSIENARYEISCLFSPEEICP